MSADAVIRALFDAALAAVEPTSAVARSLVMTANGIEVSGKTLPLAGRIIAVGVGKAAVTMALGAEQALGERIDAGLVITKDGHASGPLPRIITVREAAHPVPDQRGVDATREMLALLDGLRPDDVVVALISGGGSALLEAPREPLTLDDIAHTTTLMLHAGAPIHDLNAVRSPLSLVKGGGLRRVAGAATVITLILSDVLSNDPRVIASGPTVNGGADPSRALALLQRYGLEDRVSPAVIAFLRTRSASEPVATSRDILAFVGDNQLAVDAAAAAATARGLKAEVRWTRKEGEASVRAREWVGLCQSASPDVDLLLGGGELTVTVRGNGVGGRNTEFALEAALALAESGDTEWTIASLATDGQDGLTGVAGAISDATLIDRAKAVGLDLAALIAANDTLRAFTELGGAVDPGPTGTNVCDLFFALRTSAIARPIGSSTVGRP